VFTVNIGVVAAGLEFFIMYDLPAQVVAVGSVTLAAVVPVYVIA
jgi:hypothetical protein